MSNIAKINEIKVGAKLTVVKDRIKEIRDNRTIVMTEDTLILEVLDAVTDILMEAEKSIAIALERHERQIELLAKHLGNKLDAVEGDKQIVD